MDETEAADFIAALYTTLLSREPTPKELALWCRVIIQEGQSPVRVLRAFASCDEYEQKHLGFKNLGVPPGHYLSPVVDTASVHDYIEREQSRPMEDQLQGIEIDPSAMRKLWLANMPVISQTPFTEATSEGNRYHYSGGPFPWGDAIVLRMMMHHYRPRRIIEIGSGFSSACMLDSAEHAGLSPFKLTCIDPYADRLRSLLRPGDTRTVEIIETPVQDVAESIVDALEENDILFIDSTHVLKTGSDVHYELFRLIPALKKGVLIHFHDIQFPFEYPDEWIFERRYSWNEIYALRAFLMYNHDFQVLFWNSMYARIFTAETRQEYPDFLRNPGGSIWLQRTGAPK